MSFCHITMGPASSISHPAPSRVTARITRHHDAARRGFCGPGRPSMPRCRTNHGAGWRWNIGMGDIAGDRRATEGFKSPIVGLKRCSVSMVFSHGHSRRSRSPERERCISSSKPSLNIMKVPIASQLSRRRQGHQAGTKMVKANLPDCGVPGIGRDAASASGTM